eukprot:gene34418-41660_t
MSMMRFLSETIETVCIDWLDAKDLVNLDSACTNRLDRAVLLKSLSDPRLKSVVLTRELTIDLRMDFFLYIEWVRKRGCRLAPVNVDLDLDVILQLTHKYPFVGELAIYCEHHHKEKDLTKSVEKCFAVFPNMTGLAVLNSEVSLSTMQCLTNAPMHIQLSDFAIDRLSKPAYADKVLLAFLQRHQHSLQSFSVDMQPYSRAVFDFLCQHCVKMEELELTNENLADNIRREHFAAALLRCRHLRSLDVQGVDMQLTAQEVVQLAANNPGLQALKISDSMQGASAIAILHHCPGIEQIMSANLCYSAQEDAVDVDELDDSDDRAMMRFHSIPQRSVLARGSFADLLLDIGALAASFSSQTQLREFLEAVPVVHSLALVCDDQHLSSSPAHAWLPAALQGGKHAGSLETICLLGCAARFAAALLPLLRVCPASTHLVVDYSSDAPWTSAQLEKGLVEPLCAYGGVIERCHLCYLPALTSKHVERVVESLPHMGDCTAPLPR